MLDNIMELLGESMDAANRVADLDKKLAPLMAQIHANSDKVDPQLKSTLDKTMNDIHKKRSELENLKAEISKNERTRSK